MKAVNLEEVPAKHIRAHDGQGEVLFREVLSEEFRSGIDFLHHTILPPGSGIGVHRHSGTEEVYIVLRGTGEITVNGEKWSVRPGDVVLAHNGDSHGLMNDSRDDLVILVFEGTVS